MIVKNWKKFVKSSSGKWFKDTMEMGYVDDLRCQVKEQHPVKDTEQRVPRAVSHSSQIS